MNIFLDANILVSVLNKEYPLYHNTSRILSLGNRSNFQLFTSPLCLAIAFYFSEKKSGRDLAKKKIELLSDNLNISRMDETTVSKAVKNKVIPDFEDGLEYYSAEQAKCKLILTEDREDFFFSTIEVINAGQFVEQYMK